MAATRFVRRPLDLRHPKGYFLLSSNAEHLNTSSPGYEVQNSIFRGATLSRKDVCFACLAVFIFSSLLSSIASWQVFLFFNGLDERQTPYARLERNIPVHISDEHSAYQDRNDTIALAAWEAINIDAGTVAISDNEAQQLGLPPAQRFPWDKNKGIYLINGFHSLHCTREIYISLSEYRRGMPQTRDWDHIVHCLDQLREETICTADDTPRYTTSSASAGTGMGQVRMCRSWARLEAWARDRNACYRYVNQTLRPTDFPLVYRYLFCPEGSPYAKEVDKVFPPV